MWKNAWCCAWASVGPSGEPPLVRIHSQCLTGDVFHSLRCDCRSQLELSLNLIAEEGRGLLIYEHQEGRGIGLLNKLRAYELQDGGADTVEANERLGFEADLRDYRMPADILRYFKIKSVRLLSNNPDKIAALENAGIRVAERIPVHRRAARIDGRIFKDEEAEDGAFAGLAGRRASEASGCKMTHASHALAPGIDCRSECGNGRPQPGGKLERRGRTDRCRNCGGECGHRSTGDRFGAAPKTQEERDYGLCPSGRQRPEFDG